MDLDEDATFTLDVGGVDLDETVLAGELEGVLDQIDHDLLKAHVVTRNERGHRFADRVDELFALYLGVPLEHQINVIQYVMERKRSLV